MKIDTPKVHNDLELRSFQDILLEEDAELAHCLIKDALFENERLERPRLSNMIIKGSSFVQSDFEGIDVVDTRFENCDLSNVNMSKSSIHRVEFINCKLLGVNMTESSIGNVNFQDSIANMAMFADSKLEKVIFNNTQLQNADFYSCKFKKVDFDSCNLNEASFQDTSMKGIDISTSTFDDLTISIETVKGCTISSYQAIHFSRLMGLIIKDV
ncbi:pentapeptide repeat-containing protein [Kurthia sibirica]|uniref:Pentapeptide repeat-containing protein n=1 Tax=Kurthia sibirica TaxID=202750 RepID=A0A2U3AJF9_9BACL|nr:pentapeptide repeat-containing protein [Kurthia sibirica]PWI24601.1 pentapeptide repeat-containing protein [Kurthia sibirica]GEK33557.1 quinolone resistance protein [Kurthia sibirica]